MAALKIDVSEKYALLIDGDCIYCERFAEISKAKMAFDDIEIIDLRKRRDIVDQMRKQGFPPENGMLLKIEDNLYYGEDAVLNALNMFERLSSVDKILKYFFTGRWTSRAMYAIFRLGRSFTLRIRGRTPKF